MRTMLSLGRPALIAALLLVLVSGQPSAAFSITLPITICSCAMPTNPAIVEQASNYVVLSWGHNEQDVSFKVWYHRRDDNYTSAETTTSSKYIQYSDLPAGTYSFYVAAVCGGETSQAIILDDLVML